MLSCCFSFSFSMIIYLLIKCHYIDYALVSFWKTPPLNHILMSKGLHLLIESDFSPPGLHHCKFLKFLGALYIHLHARNSEIIIVLQLSNFNNNKLLP